jgi:hypothetical protein
VPLDQLADIFSLLYVEWLFNKVFPTTWVAQQGITREDYDLNQIWKETLIICLKLVP